MAGLVRPVYQPTGRLSHEPFDRGDRTRDVGALDVLGHVAVVDPAPAVARHLPARGAHRARRVRVALQGLAHRVDGERHAVRRERAVEAPETGARTVGEHRLGVQVTPAHHGRRTDQFVKEPLRGAVAFKDALLPAFLVVEDETDRDTGPAGPRGMRRPGAVTDEVALILGHGPHPTPAAPPDPGDAAPGGSPRGRSAHTARCRPPGKQGAGHRR